jgi:Family of unknown function (DUF6504)
VTKRYEEPIEVTSDPAGAPVPVAFRWRGRRYDVDQHLGAWRDAAEFWAGDGRRDREYFRVVAHPVNALATGDLDPDGFLRSYAAVYDVYRDLVKGAWRLERVWD